MIARSRDWIDIPLMLPFDHKLFRRKSRSIKTSNELAPRQIGQSAWADFGKEYGPRVEYCFKGEVWTLVISKRWGGVSRASARMIRRKPADATALASVYPRYKEFSD
ncbi:hypothetical protein KGP36_00545 [Patescibacteria group bacterium]|nr:hypothetical protein [Patescibacteria group bacterium]MDE1940543.1 hypothetical protein [Patescibacteria group bacterium]